MNTLSVISKEDSESNFQHLLNTFKKEREEDLDRPVLSIIIPAYNVEEFIREAIESIQNQTFSDLEILVVDDGSTDKTRSIVEDMAKGDERIRMFCHNNKGASGSRNTALKEARGWFIGFLDSDDRWDPNKAKIHLETLLSDPSIDLTFSWWRMVDENGNDLGREGKPSKRIINLEDLIIQNLTGTASTLVCRKDVLDKSGFFDEDLKAAVDLDFILRIAAVRKENIYCIPQILTDYRIRQGQITGNWKKMAENWEKVIAKIKKIESGRVATVENIARTGQYRYYSYLAYNSGDFEGARKCLRKFYSSPFLSFLFDRRTVLTTIAILLTFLPKKLHLALANRAEQARAKVFGKNGQ